MAKKKIFTDESLATFVGETKSYVDSVASTKSDTSHDHDGIYASINEATTTVTDDGEGNVILTNVAVEEGSIVEEVDPTVPAWAKEPTKPSYTAEEVGAIPNTISIPSMPRVIKVVIPASGWDTTLFSQTVTVEGISEDTSAQRITVAPSFESMAEVAEKQVVCSSQGQNSLTFSLGTVNLPIEDITMLVSVQEVEGIEDNTICNFLCYPYTGMISGISDFSYNKLSEDEYQLTSWKNTRFGTTSTELIIPDSSKIQLVTNNNAFNFRRYNNATKIVVPSHVKSTNFGTNQFANMKNLVTCEWNHPNTTNMSNAFANCTNLTSHPVCGVNVNDMRNAYYQCTNLTGHPVCGNNVKLMSSAYYNCTNLTGSPVIGPSVNNASSAYSGCVNLNGTIPTNFGGSDLTYMSNIFSGCTNLNYEANIRIVSNQINQAYGAFKGKNVAQRTNIYIHGGTSTENLFRYKNSNSLVGQNITWTNMTNGFYNAAYNIYIYTNLA